MIAPGGEHLPDWRRDGIQDGHRQHRETNCMSGRVFVDTNVLVSAHDVSAGAKHNVAKQLVRDLWDRGDGVLSTQVLQELCINIRRRTARPRSMEEVQRLIQDHLDWEIVTNDADSVLRALIFEQRYRVSFWDALILQAADSAGVETLLSEDLSAGQKYGTFRVENPFDSLAEQ
jgi:predicted nucleic acid-binding protein